MRPFVLYGLASVALIAALGWALSLVFVAPGEVRSIWIAAAVAFPVQLFGFMLARTAGRQNMIAGWGVGMIVRLITLGLFAFLISPALGLVSGAALISLVAFFFVSTLVEPLFLLL